MTGTRDQDWLPGERAVEVAPRFAPRVGDPVPRRLNHVAGRTLTEEALETEQEWRDRRFAFLGRALEPGIIEGMEVEVLDDGAGSATLRVSAGTGLASSGEDVSLRRPLVVRLDDIPPAEPLIHEGSEPRGLVVLSLKPMRGLAARAADPEDPCPTDVEAYAYADLVTLDGAQLVWERLDDEGTAELPEEDARLLRPVLPALRGIRIAAEAVERGVLGPLSSRNLLIPPSPLLGRAESLLVPQTVARNTTAHRLFDQEADAAMRGEDAPWAAAGLPLAVLQIGAEGNILYLDRFSVARMGGAPRQALPSTGMGLPPTLRRARFDQFLDQLQDLRAEGAALAPAGQHFRILPPIGILPATLIDFEKMSMEFFPSTYLVEAAPIPVEQLEAALSDRSSLEPFDLARRDYVQVIVPVPDHLYEPRLLLKDMPAQEIAVAIAEARIVEAIKQSCVDDLDGMEAEVIGAVDLDRVSDPAPPRPAGTSSERRFGEEARAMVAELHESVDDLPLDEDELAAVDPEEFDGAVATIRDGDPRDQLVFRGLKPVVADLTAKLEKANDFIDLSFMRLQADIYRARKQLLGEEDSTRLATSPVLANLATGVTGLEASQKIHDLFLRDKRSAPQPNSDMKIPERDDGGGGGTAPSAAFDIRSIAAAPTRPMSFDFNRAVASSFGDAQNIGMVALEISSGAQTFGTATSATPAGIIGNEFTTFKVGLANARMQSSTIAWQGLVYGRTSPVRTVTVAERLRPSPAQEAKNAAVATKAEIARGLQDLSLNMSGLPIPLSARRTALVPLERFKEVVEGQADNVSAVLNNPEAAPQVDGLVVVNDQHLIGSARSLFPNSDAIVQAVAQVANTLFGQRAGLDMANLSGLILSDRLDPDPADPDEGAYYAAAVDALESAVSMLRLVEARVHAYTSFLDLARDTLIRLYDLSEAWQGALDEAAADLAEATHDRTVAAALWEEENQRVDEINARRADILDKNVEIIAFARPRSLDRFADAPGMDLYAPLEDPIPACLEGGDPPPEELEQMVDNLREVPVGWFPVLAAQIDRINRPRRFRRAWALSRDRALSWLGRAPELTGRFGKAADQSRVAGKAATGVRLALAASHARLADIVAVRAIRPLDDLAVLSWRGLRDRALKELSIDDLAGAGREGAQLNRAGLRELGQIGSVAGCFLAALRGTPTTIRLQWAEALSVHDDPPDLSVITRAPGWTSIPFEQRRLLEHLHRWLFARVDTGIDEARGVMSEIVRVCLLLASHAPVSGIVEGRPSATKTLARDETFEVAIAKGEAAVGMIASFGGGKSGLGVVKDVIGTKALVQVTHASQGQLAVSPAEAVRFTAPVEARLMTVTRF